MIPTHNEAQAIGRVLADLPSDVVTEVIVVDSNSSDGTPEIAAKMGARVVQEPRRGYGRACLTGLAAANSPDVVVFLDGDYSDRPSELPILLAPIIEGRADITLGSRLQKQCSRALPWHQVFGNRLAALLIRLLYGVKISDLGPFRAGRADILRALALEEAIVSVLEQDLHGVTAIYGVLLVVSCASFLAGFVGLFGGKHAEVGMSLLGIFLSGTFCYFDFLLMVSSGLDWMTIGFLPWPLGRRLTQPFRG